MTSHRVRTATATQPVSDDLPEKHGSNDPSGADRLEGAAGDVADKAADLSATVGAFAARMQRRKREQEERNQLLDQATRVRQQLLMMSMVKIRRSLEEVERIDLGERFCLELQKDDHNGWPRFTLRLLDQQGELPDLPYLRVIAHDRQNRGAIEITYLLSEPAETLSMAREIDQQRLPTVLKMCVRSFLDHIGELVLEVDRAVDNEAAELAALQRAAAEAQASHDPNQIAETDFFDDGYAINDTFERLPELEHVQMLTTSTKQ